MNYRDCRRLALRYSHRESGFFRMNFLGRSCGLRFVIIDTKKHPALYGDRKNGWKIGRFVVRLHWQELEFVDPKSLAVRSETSDRFNDACARSATLNSEADVVAFLPLEAIVEFNREARCCLRSCC